MTSALIIDDHPMIHLGCTQMLRDLGFVEVHVASSAEEGIDQARAHCPDFVVLDLGLPGATGLDAIAPLFDVSPNVRLLVFSMNDRPIFAARALEAGAHGFLSKNAPPARFREAVTTILNGEIHLDHDVAITLVSQRAAGEEDPLKDLTPRESKVLTCLAEGLDLTEIAERLEVSYKTVANTSSVLKRKLGARSQNDLIRIAVEAKQ